MKKKNHIINFKKSTKSFNKTYEQTDGHLITSSQVQGSITSLAGHFPGTSSPKTSPK